MMRRRNASRRRTKTRNELDYAVDPEGAGGGGGGRGGEREEASDRVHVRLLDFQVELTFGDDDPIANGESGGGRRRDLLLSPPPGIRPLLRRDLNDRIDLLGSIEFAKGKEEEKPPPPYGVYLTDVLESYLIGVFQMGLADGGTWDDTDDSIGNGVGGGGEGGGGDLFRAPFDSVELVLMNEVAEMSRTVSEVEKTRPTTAQQYQAAYMGEATFRTLGLKPGPQSRLVLPTPFAVQSVQLDALADWDGTLLAAIRASWGGELFVGVEGVSVWITARERGGTNMTSDWGFDGASSRVEDTLAGPTPSTQNNIDNVVREGEDRGIPYGAIVIGSAVLASFSLLCLVGGLLLAHRRAEKNRPKASWRLGGRGKIEVDSCAIPCPHGRLDTHQG